jgi:subtilisin family serine protease
MFLLKNKIDKNLSYYLDHNSYKKYRVLIKCNNLRDNIVKKIHTYKGDVLYSLEYSNIICAKLNSTSIKQLIEYPEINYICFDEYLFLCGISVTKANKIYSSYTPTKTGKGIGVGVVDSGVFPHDDLLRPSNKIETFVDLINGFKFPYDDNGHGTCTCGIISGSGISSNNMYRGMAPGSVLYCYKAFDKLGKGFVSDTLYSIEELIKNNFIRVLCLPFELLNHNIFIIDLFNTLFLKAIEKGITPIVPSGSNINIESSIMGIATLQSCITVGGIDTTTSPTPYTFSSSGPYCKLDKPDISSACVGIYSLNSNNNFVSEKDGIKLYPPKLDAYYKSFTGTSLAVASISGICALLYEDKPSLSFQDISSLLKLSCELGDFNKNQLGEGILNVSRLLS